GPTEGQRAHGVGDVSAQLAGYLRAQPPCEGRDRNERQGECECVARDGEWVWRRREHATVHAVRARRGRPLRSLIAAPNATRHEPVLARPSGRTGETWVRLANMARLPGVLPRASPSRGCLREWTGQVSW